MRLCGSRPARGLVEKQDGGPVGDGAGNLHPLRQSAGELRRVHILALGEQELLQQLEGARLGLQGEKPK